jgi:hypothetical protein
MISPKPVGLQFFGLGFLDVFCVFSQSVFFSSMTPFPKKSVSSYYLENILNIQLTIMYIYIYDVYTVQTCI